MNDNRLALDDPIEWLNRARSNLTQAQTRVAGVYLEDLCFAAQQAAEKATKAVLIYLGINFPYTHDMTRLLSLIEQAKQDVPDGVKAAAALSDYAVEDRYPGPSCRSSSSPGTVGVDEVDKSSGGFRGQGKE